MYAVILCGGSGTRLWPLSRKNFPKQFLKLYSDKSLLEETFLRMAGAIPKDNIFLITNEENFFNVFNQIKEIYPKFKKDRIIIEPESLNTAPAIMLAVKYLKDVINIDSNEPIIEVHSDHYIGKKQAYLNLVRKAIREVGDNLGIIGITPTKADTGLGYIKKGPKKSNFWKVDKFKEKPDLKTAEKFLKSGNYLWNAGMYIFNIKTFSDELKKYAPDMYAIFSENYSRFIKDFKKLPNIAIEYAITEKSDKVIMFEGNFGWSDIGSFDVLSEIASKNKETNKKQININSKNIYVHSDNNRLVATVGVDDINIVESYDAILVQKKGEGADVKKVVEYLKEHKSPEVEHRLIEYRPWGKFDVLFDGPSFKVKKFVVYPKSRLSLQSHKFRSEHWVVVKGKAKITKGKKVILLKEGESTFVPTKTTHRFENPTNKNAEFIEVQLGSYLGEDDVARYEDDYNRK
ncbi:MAG: mannose-1-phosphate guanylyltransferase/mannose-6-phosphate isomerase [bacterium]|nr:mannose-1-phosphate guanylyltransferase/mannose-6-phosphate isomerase [bacterium]